ncbi:hypothetical protein KY289_007305 [Solanum tuberosum]|nr:hypothetical protein KY289_007305 [Solanum tuberosum]
MGGVGKTTLARAVFDTLSPQFQGASYLADEEGKRLMAHRLRFMKVLVVLDDINHHDHWEYLAGDLRWFGPGSRIITTTRNKQILGMNIVVHEVTTLLEHDDIRLFNHHSFKGEAPDENIKKLSLEDKEKTIFLDIACFFRGMRKDNTIKILESYDLDARNRLHGLIEKYLVFKSNYDTIQMHDLIQDMGRYVVKRQKDSGQPSRLWNIEDLEDVMVNNTGTMAVEAIWFTYSEKLCFSKDAMKNMQSLRILGIFPKDRSYMMPYFNCQDGSIEYLSSNLRCFVWHYYPWKLLPENFNPRRLVHLDLRWNSLQYLCNETKLPQFPSLQRIDLSCSKSLKRTPDFEGMPNLKYLNLEQCTSLEEVHPSLKDCKTLIELNLSDCTKLERFPYVNVESLESLNLSFCSSLKKCPEIMKQGTTIKIKMSCSGIRELPLSFFDLQPHLTELELYGMKNLVSLPSSIWKLKGLVRLNVSNWSKLKSLPKEIGDLDNLEELPARYIPISRPLSSIVRLNKLKSLTLEKEESKHTVNFVFPQVSEGLRSLESLDLSYCNIIDGGLPQDIGSLSSLKKLNLKGNNFEYLPHSISQLGALQTLNLSHCKRLRQLPGFTGMQCLDTLDLSFCNLTDGVLLDLLDSIGQLGALRILDLLDCKRLTQQLDTICVDWSTDWICNSLFQNFSALQHDISASDSLSLRVFTLTGNIPIPRWFDHREDGRSISVKLPENWYVSDNFLGFAVCYSGELIDAIAHLICYDERPVTRITQKLALSNHSVEVQESPIHFFLVPLTGLLDKSKANGKTPNDYGRIRIFSTGEMKEFGLRLLYKDKPKIEASCSSSQKQ